MYRTEKALVPELQHFLDRVSEEDLFSGAILVARHGEVLFKAAYGMASKGYAVNNGTDTKFNLGSMNKMFTAVTIAHLAEQGIVNVEEVVGKYLPDFPSRLSQITVHQLLTHTSGMGTYWNDKYIASIARIKSVKDYTRLFIEDPLLFEPGAKWEYSNAGYIVLGAIIESVTGKDYFEVVKEVVYKPAHMFNTDCYDLEYDVPNLAIGYTRYGVEDKGVWRNNLFLHVVKGGPAGGGYSTVEDLFNFDIAIRGNKLLGSEWTERVTRGKVELTADFKYGYGFGEKTLKGERIIGHNGGFPGISSTLNMYMNSGYTLAVMSNYDNGAILVEEKFNELLLG
ncbi:serine hydrolase domain-containing protein [Paenibacillus tarimensis]